MVLIRPQNPLRIGYFLIYIISRCVGFSYLIFFLKIYDTGYALVYAVHAYAAVFHLAYQKINICIVKCRIVGTVHIPGQKEHVYSGIYNLFGDICRVLGSPRLTRNKIGGDAPHFQRIGHNDAVVTHVPPQNIRHHLS